MKSLKESFNLITLGSIILDVIFILLGIFLIANPSVGLESGLVLLGIILLISGLFSIIKYVTNGSRFFKFELVFGIISFIAGLFAMIKPFDVATLITVLVGIWLILSSAVKFAMAVEFRKLRNGTWAFDLTISTLTILLGIMFLINPFKGYMILTSYAGVLIMIYSAMDIVQQLFIRQRVNDIIKLFK